MSRNHQSKTIFKIPLIFLATLCIAMTSCGQAADYEDYSGETYNIVRPQYTPEYEKYTVGPAPSGVNMTYYSDIYSRGFSWLTDKDTPDTELYILKSDKGEGANFAKAKLVKGESIKISFATSGKISSEGNVFPAKTGSSNSSNLTCYSHKAHVENLEKGKAYSYKIGSKAGVYTYGAFIVEQDQPETIEAIQMSDAQTKDPSKLNVWRNTFTKAVTTAGKDLDTVLYNGDQFDQNMEKINGARPLRFLMYSKALDIIQDYKFNLPYMTSAGNHEPSAPYSQYLHSDVNYAGYSDSGTYYSYDYNFAHFVVLNTNDVSTKQINWLKEDLDKASNAKWKIVMMHIACYSTGDHSNASTNQNNVKKLSPIFASKHVDLVLQAHDHTYNKTLPYKWDAAGYTETYDNAEVVNYNPQTETKKVGDKDVVFDKNPQGTYYVTTGAAGHRCGAEEEDGIWAEVTYDENGKAKGLNPSKTYLDDKYKIEMGKLTENNEYTPYTFGSYTSNQQYKVGDLATGNVNAQMFGVLKLSKTTLTYDAYTVNGETVKLFDSLNVAKD